MKRFNHSTKLFLFAAVALLVSSISASADVIYNTDPGAPTHAPALPPSWNMPLSIDSIEVDGIDYKVNFQYSNT